MYSARTAAAGLLVPQVGVVVFDVSLLHLFLGTRECEYPLVKFGVQRKLELFRLKKKQERPYDMYDGLRYAIRCTIQDQDQTACLLAWVTRQHPHDVCRLPTAIGVHVLTCHTNAISRSADVVFFHDSHLEHSMHFLNKLS